MRQCDAAVAEAGFHSAFIPHLGSTDVLRRPSVATRADIPERRNAPFAGRLAERAEADGRTRTGDPFITSEVLYQLSYGGGAASG